MDDAERLVFIREETRFEVGLLHDRINALISAEAFLTIAYTMAMTSDHRGAIFSMLVAPMLAVVGLLLAVLAWPGVDASFKIIVEWNSRQVQVMQENPLLTDTMWRPSVLGKNNLRVDPDQRTSMLFPERFPPCSASRGRS